MRYGGVVDNGVGDHDGQLCVRVCGACGGGVDMDRRRRRRRGCGGALGGKLLRAEKGGNGQRCQRKRVDCEWW